MHDSSFAVALTIAASRFSRAAVLAADTEVASATWRVASMLATYGPMRPSHIAHRERTSRAATTTLLQRLEDEGLICKSVDPSDARAYLVDLTASGRESLSRWRQRVGLALDPLVSELPEKDRQTLLRAERLMRSLTDTLEG
ncbi:MAG: MarR family transcriptional regulator [Actinomycetaceae bacterium]|nr:MarR family transcriptional regulator [Actinomycetaceae bacterium]